VRITLKNEPFNTVIATTGSCSAKSHPGATCSWQLLDYGYTGLLLYPNGAGLFNTGGFLDYGGYSNPEENKLINATEYGSSRAAFFAYEDFTARQLPFLWLPNASTLYIYKKDIAGIAPWNPFSGTVNPEVWYYTKQSS
jgi:peptide/nickel transport system substrate-binding protein